ncbi:MAG TPA: hypothetical protein VNY05_42565 [Candidatus Acidoferrales bacterium]|jgi:hypothetical protein|nr:hypothetical protein [Candidatus Acidoferrales bacterium]
MSRGSRGQYFVGVDLGQSRDFTAIAIVERAELIGAWDPAEYAHRKMAELRLRYLERIPLGTTYPDVVDRVRQVTRSAELRERCYLMVDATGVGRPVVDLLRIAGLGCPIMPAIITGADAETNSDGYYKVPKRDLIVGLQVLLQRGGLQIAAGMKLGPVLVDEMAAMRVKQTARGHEQFGAWREGEHDDLVFAVALAHWGARKVYPRRLYGDDGCWTRKGGEVAA